MSNEKTTATKQRIGAICFVCERDMYRQWAGAKWGKQKLCLNCNRDGWYFTKDGDAEHRDSSRVLATGLQVRR